MSKALSGVWKPGNPAPSSIDTETKPSDTEQSAPVAVDNKTPPKKLSGSTLNMRFMQRKAEAEEAAARKQKAEQDASTQQNINDDDEDGDASMLENDEGPDSSTMTPLIATDADIYGLEADIIGRRSFGGFNKAVAENWSSALALRQKGIGKSSNKTTLSDEELLRRYEKYVTGKADGPDVDKRATAPIGNLDKKGRQKRKKMQVSTKRRTEKLSEDKLK